MTTLAENKNNKQPKFSYDYENKCDCSEDDKCGCTYPNNLQHDFNIHCSENQENSCPGKNSKATETPMYTPASNSTAQPPLDEKVLSMGRECNCTVTREKNEIMTDNVHYKKESVCVCSPTECNCTVTNDEKSK